VLRVQAVQRKGRQDTVQMKTKSLLEIFFNILLSVMRKIFFWLVTLRLNTTLKNMSFYL